MTFPRGLVVDGADRLFIADERNERVRVVSPDGIITTLAGTGTEGYTGDGGESGLASLNAPRKLAIERNGHLLILDTGNHRVQRVEQAATPLPRVIVSRPRTPSDFNEDGHVDFTDFLVFAQAFSSTLTAFDLDGDGRVAFGDFLIFADAFGN